MTLELQFNQFLLSYVMGYFEIMNVKIQTFGLFLVQSIWSEWRSLKRSSFYSLALEKAKKVQFEPLYSKNKSLDSVEA